MLTDILPSKLIRLSRRNRTFPILKNATNKAERGTIDVDRLTVKRGTLLLLGMKDEGIKVSIVTKDVFPSIRIEIVKKQKKQKRSLKNLLYYILVYH